MSTRASPEPAQTTRLTALSLDGGGVRGYSSLLILRAIMLEIKRQNNLPQTPKPCDYFDLIAGTSTGGLAALMLGRLRMSADNAIIKYQKMSGDIFQRPWQPPLKPIWDAYKKKPWFDAETLKRSVQTVVDLTVSPEEKAYLDGCGIQYVDAPLLDPRLAPGEKECDVFVCAVKTDDLTTTLLRSYKPRSGEAGACFIWEAGRATSAAPLYFPTIKININGMITEYFDGAMKNNNPIEEVRDEVFLKYRVETPRCVVSIGTGYLENASVQTGFWAKLIKWASGGFGPLGWTLLQLALSTQSKHLEILNADKYADFRVNYFRLNVEGKIANIGIERWDKIEDMRHFTETYLATPEAKADIARIAERLGKGRDLKN